MSWETRSSKWQASDVHPAERPSEIQQFKGKGQKSEKMSKGKKKEKDKNEEEDMPPPVKYKL